MALSHKITKAVKDAQKQAEAAAADVRGQLDQLEGKLPEVSVDPTPFYAVVGAANISLDTVKTAGEQLEVAGPDYRLGVLHALGEGEGVLRQPLPRARVGHA